MDCEFTEKEIEIFLNNMGVEYLYSWAAMQFSEKNKECYEFAVKCYKLAAAQGYGQALNALGELYAEGEFVEKDMQKAFDCYIRSAEKGYDEAYCNLGYFYLYGINCDIDYKKAYEYFSRGATIGYNDSYINCLYELGDMYMHGSYVDENPNVAFNYYTTALRKAKDNGFSYFLPDIEYRIGKCYYGGNGVERDKELACGFLKAALDKYETRTNDPYNYKAKRINEINDMITECTGICVATPVQIPEEE